MVQSILLGEHIHLTALDLEHEAATIAGWTQDPEFWNLYDREIPRPLSPTQVKKKYTVEPKNELTDFPFAIRARVDERLVGIASLHWVEWSNSNAWLTLSIGSAEDRWRGLETETLDLLLTFAFRELNLYRLQVNAPEYALSWRDLLEKQGFKLEVCQREEIQGASRAWDMLIYGLLAEEWAPAARAGVNENG